MKLKSKISFCLRTRQDQNPGSESVLILCYVSRTYPVFGLRLFSVQLVDRALQPLSGRYRLFTSVGTVSADSFTQIT